MIDIQTNTPLADVYEAMTHSLYKDSLALSQFHDDFKYIYT